MRRTRVAGGRDGRSSDGDDEVTPRTFGSVDAGAVTRRLVPQRVRQWAISVDVSTPRSEYPADGAVPFTVTVKNVLPFPVSLKVRSRRFWTWSVDGLTDASHVPARDPAGGTVVFEFGRGERKQFRKRWHGSFRLSDDEWERAGPGEYTIAATLNVDDAEKKGLAAHTTVRLV